MTSRRQPGGARRHHATRGEVRGGLAAVAIGLALGVPVTAGAQVPTVGTVASAETSAGLGLLRLRQGRYAEAVEALNHAVAADPTAGHARWGGALSRAGFAADLAAGRSAIAAGQFDVAEAALSRAARRDTPERADAEMLLGDLALRRGDPAGAEPRYRAALAARPGLGGAVTGLHGVLRQQGRFAEAEAYAHRGGSAGWDARADSMRAEAARITDPDAALTAYRAALATSPGNPGMRLDVARVLATLGRPSEGRALVEDGVAGPSGAEGLHAAALFAREDGRPADAVRFVSRVPERLRTADMVRLVAQLRLESEVAAVAAMGREEGRRGLLAIAARPDPSGTVASLAIRALTAAGDRDGAVTASRLAAAAPRPPAGRLALAGAVLDAGLTAEADAILAPLTGAPGLSAAEARQVSLLRAAPADGSRVIQAGPATRPEAVEAEMRSPAEALRIAEAVLRRDPRNAAARYAGIEAAMALDDLGRAEALLMAGQATAPTDPRLTVFDARLARRAGDTRRAQTALSLAAEQRRSQLGVDRPAPASEAPAASRPAAPVIALAAATPPSSPRRMPLAGDGQGSSFAPLGSNPGSVASGGPGGIAGDTALNDPLLSEIGRQLVEVNNEAASRITVSGTGRYRSGERGLERLYEYGGGVEGSVPAPGIGGVLSARAQAVHLDAGRADVNSDFNIRRYGSNATEFSNTQNAADRQALRERLRPRDTTATGVAIGAAYQRDWLTVDVGSSPLGFREQNILGGVEVTPDLGNGFRLRLRGERRAVSDSLLSWGGVRDPVSGRTFGGVTRNGGLAQVEYSNDTFGAYLGAGYSHFEGRNVQDNGRLEVSGGVSQAIFRRPTQELITGLDLAYLSYDRNLRHFSLGHGGYFSPQDYAAAQIPLDYRARNGNLAYRVGGGIGVAYFREERSPFFPGNTALQAGLEQQAATDPNVTAFYARQQRTALTGTVRADIEYAITPAIRIGALARYERTADFDEARGMIYARFRLD